MRTLAVLGVGPVDPDRPALAADDLAVTRGDGCFEGLRVRRGPDGPVVDKLDAHLDRLRHSAAALGIAVDDVAWKDLLAAATEAWFAATDEPEGAVKLLLSRGRPDGPHAGEPTGYVSVSDVGPAVAAARRDGVTAVTLTRGLGPEAFAGAPWLLGGVKTLSYAVNVAAQREAARRGADDVVFLATDGSLLEAPTASVVWVDADGALTTVAPGTNGILAGTTQRLLFARAAAAGRVVRESGGTVADLVAARCVLLVSSVRGPVAVTALDGRPLPTDAGEVAVLQQLAGFSG